MNEYVLLLGANQYLRERSLAGAKAVTPLPIWTAGPNAKTDFNRYFDHCLEADPLKADSLLAIIGDYQKKGWSPKAVVPLNDWTLKAANDVNKELNLIHLDQQAIHLSRNKFAMKKALQKHEVKTAPFILVENEEALLKAIAEIELPVVIKPFDFGGSGGVYLARTQEEAIASFHESKSMMAEYAQQFGVEGDKYLVEKYIDSKEEVSVEVLCYQDAYQVITITEKYLSPEPWFAEMAHLVPSHRVNNRHLQELACQACRALGIKLGLAHVEIKIKDDEAWVIEVAARPGGDGIMDQIERAYGLNPYSLHVSAYLGQDPFALIGDLKPHQTAAIAFLKARPGVIKEINMPEQLSEEIHSLRVQAKVGDISEDPTCWRTREGVVEYTWPTLFSAKTDQPLRLTQELSDRIFKV